MSCHFIQTFIKRVQENDDYGSL